MNMAALLKSHLPNKESLYLVKKQKQRYSGRMRLTEVMFLFLQNNDIIKSVN